MESAKSMIHYAGALIGQEERDAINEAIGDGFNWVFAQKGLEYESKLAEMAGCKYAVATNSGTSALLLTMLALDIPPKSRIAIPATCFLTAVSAIVYAGHVPVIVDSDLTTFNIDLDSLDQAVIDYDIRVGLVPLIAGNVPDIEELRNLLDILILDNCDGFSGTYKGKYVESYADATAISSHAAHVFNTGEGGALITNDPVQASRARCMRDWGRSGGTGKEYQLGDISYPDRYIYHELGLNLKMMELQAAMGSVQLTRLEGFKQKRLRNFEILSKGIARSDSLITVEVIPNAVPTWFAFPIWCDNRKRVENLMKEHNIETRRVFLGNLVRQPVINKFEHLKVDSYCGADSIMEHGLLLPLSPRYGEDVYEHIADLLSKV